MGRRGPDRRSPLGRAAFGLCTDEQSDVHAAAHWPHSRSRVGVRGRVVGYLPGRAFRAYVGDVAGSSVYAPGRRNEKRCPPQPAQAVPQPQYATRAPRTCRGHRRPDSRREHRRWTRATGQARPRRPLRRQRPRRTGSSTIPAEHAATPHRRSAKACFMAAAVKATARSVGKRFRRSLNGSARAGPV